MSLIVLPEVDTSYGYRSNYSNQIKDTQNWAQNNKQVVIELINKQWADVPFIL